MEKRNKTKVIKFRKPIYNKILFFKNEEVLILLKAIENHSGVLIATKKRGIISTNKFSIIENDRIEMLKNYKKQKKKSKETIKRIGILEEYVENSKTKRTNALNSIDATYNYNMNRLDELYKKLYFEAYHKHHSPNRI